MCHEHNNIWPLIISILAVIGTFWNAQALQKYSRRNIIHLFNQLMLQKAKDCNAFWVESTNNELQQHERIRAFINTFSEIIISIQLLNNSLNTYHETGKRNFLLLQFWIQLDTSLREYIKNDANVNANNHLPNIRDHFRQFFANY